MTENEFNPFQAPQTVGPARVQPLTPVQRAREQKHMNQIKQCRGLLVFVGVLTIALNGWQFYNSPVEAQQAVQAELAKVNLQPGQFVIPEKRLELEKFVLFFCRVVYGSLLAVGVAEILLAMIVTKYPVPATITAMTLYVLANVVILFLNPQAIASGAIFKIIILVSLGKAIQAAFAYQREVRNRDYQSESSGDDAPPWLKTI